MLRRIGVVAAVFALAAPVAHARGLRSTYNSLHKRVVHELGKRAPGRNIAAVGVRTRHGARHARRHDLVHSITVLRRMIAPPPQSPATPAATSSAPSSGLSAIANCESGGDPTAVDASGTYRGKYQFDQQTWKSVGGTGDPAAAPESEQDALAAKLQAQRGDSPWPVCG